MVILAFSVHIRRFLVMYLESIILYGSVARGIQTAESDVDIAVTVRRYTEDMHDKMIDLTVDLELEYNKVLSVLLIDYDNFREWKDVLPFYKNQRKERMRIILIFMLPQKMRPRRKFL